MKLAKLKAVQADLWFFDNDGTLYGDTAMQLTVTKLMDRFFARMHSVEESEGRLLREKLKKKHAVSSTVVALHREGIFVETFIQETYLAVDFRTPGICPPTPLTALVPHLHGEKIVLTNSPSEFARRVLNVLGIENAFSQVYGARELNYFSKPAKEAFAPLFAAVRQGERVVYIDDKISNLTATNATTEDMIRLWWNGKQLVEIGGNCEAR